VIDESDLHPVKHREQRISTLLGIKIDRSDEYANNSGAIRVKCECDSIEMEQNIVRPLKHSSPNSSIDSGIQTRA
jgi:hypothetical protein